MPSYLPIVILGAIALGFGVVVLTLSYVIGRPRPDSAKLSTYECGMPPVGTARERFPIKFYLVCMLFILFDVETAFFYPWAVLFRDLSCKGQMKGAICHGGATPFGLLVMLVFLAILVLALLYVWRKKALEWD